MLLYLAVAEQNTCLFEVFTVFSQIYCCGLSLITTWVALDVTFAMGLSQMTVFKSGGFIDQIRIFYK